MTNGQCTDAVDESLSRSDCCCLKSFTQAIGQCFATLNSKNIENCPTPGSVGYEKLCSANHGGGGGDGGTDGGPNPDDICRISRVKGMASNFLEKFRYFLIWFFKITIVTDIKIWVFFLNFLILPNLIVVELLLLVYFWNFRCFFHEIFIVFSWDFYFFQKCIFKVYKFSLSSWKFHFFYFIPFFNCLSLILNFSLDAIEILTIFLNLPGYYLSIAFQNFNLKFLNLVRNFESKKVTAKMVSVTWTSLASRRACVTKDMSRLV